MGCLTLLVQCLVIVKCDIFYSTESCQDGTERKCNFHNSFDTSFVCVSTTLSCVNNGCTAVINSNARSCQFTGAGASQPVHCCLCHTNTTGSLQLLWDCIITTLSPSSSSCEYSNNNYTIDLRCVHFNTIVVHKLKIYSLLPSKHSS